MIPTHFDFIHLALILALAYYVYQYNTKNRLYSKLYYEHRQFRQMVLVVVSIQAFAHLAKYFKNESKR
jgi:hypothetical protein